MSNEPLNKVQLGYIVKALNEIGFNDEKIENVVRRSYYWSTMISDKKALEEFEKFSKSDVMLKGSEKND